MLLAFIKKQLYSVKSILTIRNKIMKKTFLFTVLLLIFTVCANAQQAPKPPQTNLKVGDAAPDFSLTDTDGNAVKLSDFKGKKSVVLAFYVLAFTGG